MSEHIIWESDRTETTDYLGVKHGVSHFEKREEIVRCGDCRHYKPWLLSRPENGGDCVLNKVEVDVPPDGFCAWGERRERESAEVWNQWSADDVTCSEES